MIDKIKGLLEVKKSITHLDSRLRELEEMQKLNKEILEKNAEAIESILQLTNKLHALQKSKQSSVLDEAEEISKLRKEFEKELKKFQELQRQLYDRLGMRISEVAEHSAKQFDLSIDKLRKCCDEAGALSVEISRAKEEIAKFNTAASKIREADFEFKEAAKKLMSQDKQKIELIKKIETLKKIIAAERRRRK